MKKILVAILMFLGLFSALSAQEADRLIGTYYTEGKGGKVVVKKTGEKFYGTLVWTRTVGLKDTKNPVASERNKLVAGKVILKDFVYTGKNVWEKGTIYDPESGKTYSCKLTLMPDGKLKVRGFIGVSLLGRNSVWTPIKE
jgi:hypothetical protein